MAYERTIEEGYELPTTRTSHGFTHRGRISPFFECAEAAGARDYLLHLNSFMPHAMGDDAEGQYAALREAATLADVHSLHVIEISGPDARQFADALVTRDVTKMKAGRSSYVFCCDENGTVLADPVMLIVDDQKIWLTVGTAALELWVRGLAVNSGHDVVVKSAPAPSVQVAGPKARDVLQTLMEDDLSTLRPFRNMPTRVAGLDVLVSTTGFSGELSYEVYLIGAETYPRGRDLGNRLWSAIKDAGKPFGLRESPVRFDRATEAGFMTISHTAGDDMNALEFWRASSMVDLEKSENFVGKAALIRLRDVGGPPRRMVGLLAPLGEPMTNGEWDMSVYEGKEIVGTTRRAAWSPSLGRGIAIALVNREFAEVGRKLVLPNASGVADVEVTELPFVGNA